MIGRPEYEYCSNRGICDFTTGNCLCATGYGGIACDAAHTTYFESVNAHVYQEVCSKFLIFHLLCKPFLYNSENIFLVYAGGGQVH